MTLILVYLVVLILVAIVLFGLGSVLFGRGERLPPLPRGTTATVLPASGVTGADVEVVRFSQTLRGYKASEVDWVLERLGQELDSVRGELAAVRAAHGIAEPDDGYRWEGDPFDGGSDADDLDSDSLDAAAHVDARPGLDGADEAPAVGAGTDDQPSHR